MFLVFKKWMRITVEYEDHSLVDIDVLPLEELEALKDLVDALITVRRLLGKEAEKSE